MHNGTPLSEKNEIVAQGGLKAIFPIPNPLRQTSKMADAWLDIAPSSLEQESIIVGRYTEILTINLLLH